MLKQEKIFTTPLARAIAAALALTAAQSANALIIATNSIDGNASVLAGPADTYGPTSSTGAIFDSASASNGVHQGSASSWANQFNAYAASANGQGTFTANAHLNRKLVVTNDTGGQANTTVSFYVYGGALFNDDQGVGGDGEASYALKILVNGAQKFASAAKITSGSTLVQTGTTLAGANLSGNDYFWGGTSLLFDLGLLNALEEVTIEYDLVVSSFGNYGVIPGDGGEFCDFETGYGCCPVETFAATFAAATECSFDTAAGGASAFLGDPNEFNFQNQTAEEDIVVTFTRVPGTVPEPTSLLLTGLGLAGLGWRRRRHR